YGSTSRGPKPSKPPGCGSRRCRRRTSVRRAFETFNRGGPEAVISEGLWSPELVWDFSQTGIPGLGVYRGDDEVRSFFADDWFQAFPFEEWEVELDELIDNGDK